MKKGSGFPDQEYPQFEEISIYPDLYIKILFDICPVAIKDYELLYLIQRIALKQQQIESTK